MNEDEGPSVRQSHGMGTGARGLLLSGGGGLLEGCPSCGPPAPTGTNGSGFGVVGSGAGTSMRSDVSEEALELSLRFRVEERVVARVGGALGVLRRLLRFSPAVNGFLFTFLS